MVTRAFHFSLDLETTHGFFLEEGVVLITVQLRVCTSLSEIKFYVLSKLEKVAYA